MSKPQSRNRKGPKSSRGRVGRKLWRVHGGLWGMKINDKRNLQSAVEQLEEIGQSIPHRRRLRRDWS